MTATIDFTEQSRFSEPGRHRALLSALPTDPAGLSTVARNVVVHYRASGLDLPDSSRDDINARWLEDVLDLDLQRHARPLAEPREPSGRVQGCCRDHTLFCVGALRANGVAARSRVGFAGHFIDGWHHDHVIVEARIGGRWRRFDAELDGPRPAFPSPMDFEFDDVADRGFVTAAQVWAAHRRGEIDPETYGVDPEVPVLRGDRFIFNEVILEVAHRFGDELLLWDSWGSMHRADVPVTAADAAWLDSVAQLLLDADRGDYGAEARLLERYRIDAGLHPATTIVQASPYGDPPIEVDLADDRAARRAGAST